MRAEEVDRAGGGFSLKALMKSQELVILAFAGIVFLVMAVGLPRFLTAGNISTLMFNFSIIGILACGMAVVVIDRGIDLSLVAILAVCGACMAQFVTNGYTPGQALLFATIIGVALGLFNGLVVAYLEIPALFATLASGLFFFGISRAFILDSGLLYVPASAESLQYIANGKVLGLPLPVILFAAIAAGLHLLLSRTTFGQMVYAQGDNFHAARISGANVRLIIVIQFVIAALCGAIAGFIYTSASSAIDMQIYRSTLIFDVVLVVILGGLSLAGGRGGMLSVVAGTLLIGILLNGMIILNINTDAQNIIKGVVLIIAILLDRFINPVDEETARQGDTL